MLYKKEENVRIVIFKVADEVLQKPNLDVNVPYTFGTTTMGIVFNITLNAFHKLLTRNK